MDPSPSTFSAFPWATPSFLPGLPRWANGDGGRPGVQLGTQGQWPVYQRWSHPHLPSDRSLSQVPLLTSSATQEGQADEAARWEPCPQV